MSYIIKLQHLPRTANVTDIREYFRGLSISKGGVFIVGGENGNAFIKFKYIIVYLTTFWCEKLYENYLS